MWHASLLVLPLAAGCATFSSRYDLEPASTTRVALLVEEPAFDQWGQQWARSYPVWIRDLVAHAHPDVVLVARVDEVEVAAPDLILVVRLKQSHSAATFYIDQSIEIEAFARDGQSLHRDSELISSWNWSGSADDHQDALSEALGPLLLRMQKASQLDDHLRAPRPEYAIQFRTPPPAPPAPPPVPDEPIAEEPETPPRRMIVAVFDLESIGLRLSKPARRRLNEYLTTKVVASGRFEVVPTAELRKLLRQAKRESYRACYDEACQIELGRELAAEKSLATKILRSGDRCITTLNLYDVRKATLEAAATADGICDERSLFRAVDDALDQL